MYSLTHVEGARTWFPCLEFHRSPFTMQFTVKPEFIGADWEADCCGLFSRLIRCSCGFWATRKANTRRNNVTTHVLLQVTINIKTWNLCFFDQPFYFSLQDCGTYFPRSTRRSCWTVWNSRRSSSALHHKFLPTWKTRDISPYHSPNITTYTIFWGIFWCKISLRVLQTGLCRRSLD